jgi:hypothetical protein
VRALLEFSAEMHLCLHARAHTHTHTHTHFCLYPIYPSCVLVLGFFFLGGGGIVVVVWFWFLFFFWFLVLLLLLLLFGFSLVFPDRVSLYSPGCPGTYFVDQAGLELRNPPASAS